MISQFLFLDLNNVMYTLLLRSFNSTERYPGMQVSMILVFYYLKAS
jgi:hypothetical protein